MTRYYIKHIGNNKNTYALGLPISKLSISKKSSVLHIGSILCVHVLNKILTNQFILCIMSIFLYLPILDLQMPAALYADLYV